MATLVLAASLVMPSTPALAQSSEVENSAPLWWVLSVGEYSLVVGGVLIGSAMALAGGGGGGDIGGLLFGTALVLGIGAGFESIDKKWDPRIAIGMHDALWLGADLAALGALLAMPVLHWPLYGSIPLALAFGLLGAGGGALVGSMLRESDTEATIAYVAPLVSAAAVGLVWLTASTWRKPPLDPTTDPLFATALWTGFTLPLLASVGVALAMSGGQEQ